MAVVSKGTKAEYFNSEPVVIDSQVDLVNFVSSANREQNMYQLVTFRGEMNFIHYLSSDLFRFWFEDGNINTYEEALRLIKI